MYKYFQLIFFLFIFCNLATAQNQGARYFSLANNRVYDVEIILFAYNKALPNAESYSNKEIVDTSKAIHLEPKPTGLALIKPLSTETVTDKYTVEIDHDNTSSKVEVLAWFEHDPSFLKLKPIWSKLQQAADITPLIHRAWRQPQTQFNNPQYVAIGNEIEGMSTIPDLTINGQVALSKGRYLHFGHQVNLYRLVNGENLKNIVFSLTERKQVKPNELHYFDSPWFGSIVKITQVKGE